MSILCKMQSSNRQTVPEWIVPLLPRDRNYNEDYRRRACADIIHLYGGNPKDLDSEAKDEGIKVAHVVSSSKFATKCEEAGVDTVVAEVSRQAGTMEPKRDFDCGAIASRRTANKYPAHWQPGISTGEAMLAAMALGAKGYRLVLDLR